MRKILFWIFSAVLTAAGALSAQAAAPLAKRASGVQSELLQLAANPSSQAPSRVQTLQARTATQSLSFSRALRGQAALARPAVERVAPAGEAANLPNLHGFILYRSLEGSQYGLYKIVNGGTEFVFPTEKASNGSIEVNGVTYVTNYFSFFGYVFVSVYVYDEDGEEIASLDGTVDNLCFAQTIDPTTGIVYAITYNAEGNGIQLSTIEYTESAVTTTAIAPIDGNWNTLACDSQGQLYGISYEGETIDDSFVVTGSTLNKIDKTTGAVTVVGNTGMLPQYLSSGTIDAATDKMYWNVCAADESSILAEVNLTTGQATELFQFEYGDELMGMYVKAPAAADDAPAVPMNLTANFPEGSLSGTVSFDAPTTLFNGTAASGPLSYTLLVDGEVEAQGNTTFGATNITIPVEVSLPAEYKFVLTVANAAGNSPKAKTTVFIGHGAPNRPANVALEYSNGNLNLSWDAVTTTSDGGYIDADAVRYNVFDANDNKVADMIAVTSWSAPQAMPAELTTFQYSVQAVNAGLVSPKANSNALTLGSIVPPYAESLIGSGGLPAGFAYIDANGDGKVWDMTTKGAKMTYNSSVAMDDYLVLPPIALEAGMLYDFSVEAFANSTTFPERMEILMGSAPTVAGLTTTLLPSTTINWNEDNAKTFTMTLAPETSGVYYIAIHGISDADMFALFVRNVSVSGAYTAAAPAACSDVTITPDATGLLKAAISFKAPSLNIGGSALDAITSITVKRNGEVVKSYGETAPGATLSFEDVAPASGDYVYSFQASNDGGNGTIYTAESVHIGFGVPADLTGVNMVEQGNTGAVTITWDAVTTDVNGLTYPNPVTYAVCEYGTSGWVPFVEGLTGTSYEFQAVAAGQQEFVQYAVFPFYEGENGLGMATDLLAVGTPYTSIDESFANGSLSYILGTGFSEGASWSIVDDSQYSDLTSYDGDNGFLSCSGNYLDNKSSIFTGKVDLTGMSNPGVSYATFVITAEDINEINVYVKEPADADWTLVNNAVVAELGAESSWCVNTLSLSAYANKVVQVRFEAVVKAYKVTTLDAIKVANMLANDLAAREISAPVAVTAGTDYTVDVTVANVGTSDATEFSVELYADGQLAETKTVASLATGKSTVVSFARSMSAVAEVSTVYTAKVVYAVDEDLANNNSDEAAVAPKYSSLPVVADLAGTEGATGVKLTWSEPNLEGVGETKTEDFEASAGWGAEVEGWTFIDEDDALIGGFQNMEIPNFTAGESKASFFVWDQATSGGNSTFDAHSGQKYLAALFRYDDGTTSDWAISPALSGAAQTISFYAKSYSSSYPEKIEVYYGNGTEVSDFPAANLVKTVSAVPGDWTLVEAQLPEGANYFAIRSCATGSFMLMIDDVTYEAGGGTANLSIVGYDVYRNGEKLTAQPTGECEYVDANAPAGSNKYQVVVVYNRGTSAPAAVTVETSGLDNIAAGVSVRTADGCIIIAGAEGRNIAVNAVNGVTVYAGAGEATTRVAVATGVYLVKVDNAVTKVVVR